MTGGSGIFDVRAALAEGIQERPAGFAALTTSALPPVADAAQPGRVQRLIFESNTHGADDESVEHTRQSHLQRWQSQRD